MQKIHSNTIAQFSKLTEALNLCEDLMQENIRLKEALTNKMTETELSTYRFSKTLKHQLPMETAEMSPDTKEQITMMSSLNRMLKELKAEQGKFDSFWTIHNAHVDHMMRKCHFNSNVEKVGLQRECFNWCAAVSQYLHIYTLIHLTISLGGMTTVYLCV